MFQHICSICGRLEDNVLHTTPNILPHKVLKLGTIWCEHYYSIVCICSRDALAAGTSVISDTGKISRYGLYTIVAETSTLLLLIISLNLNLNCLRWRINMVSQSGGQLLTVTTQMPELHI